MASRLRLPQTRSDARPLTPSQLHLQRSRYGYALSVLVFCIVVWVWRRPDQVSHPYVWDEESFVLRHYIDQGWFGALKPVEGYLILPVGFLEALAAQISFVHLPRLMYAFASLMFLATIALLVFPDSRWGSMKIRGAMAAATALVPTNPEVFGILLYSAWWASLWPLIILGWRRSLWLLRAPLLAIAALSSPAGGAVSVVFGLAYFRHRRAQDAVSAIILLAGLIVQVVLTLTSSRATTVSDDATPHKVAEQFLRIGGFFETNWLAVGHPHAGYLAFIGLLFLGFLVLAGILVGWTSARDEVLLMASGALVYGLMCSLPVPLTDDPVYSGPRYFFLPFVAFSWTLLILLANHGHLSLRVASAVLLGVASLNLATTFSRLSTTTTARLYWRSELQICASSKTSPVHVPIYFDGSTTILWSLDLTPAQCRRLTR